MKKTITSILTNYRYYVLIVLMSIAILGIFCNVSDDLPLLQWFLLMIASKAVGFSTGYAVYKLITVWERENAIPELTKYVSEDEE